MTRKPHWRQDTPAMQAVAITSGIEGWLMNLEHGYSSPERVLEHVKPLIADLKDLYRIGMLSEWPKDE